jgi:hypothetical protein
MCVIGPWHVLDVGIQGNTYLLVETPPFEIYYFHILPCKKESLQLVLSFTPIARLGDMHASPLLFLSHAE